MGRGSLNMGNKVYRLYDNSKENYVGKIYYTLGNAKRAAGNRDYYKKKDFAIHEFDITLANVIPYDAKKKS